jgi:DnaJ-class molecular chaperone
MMLLRLLVPLSSGTDYQKLGIEPGATESEIGSAFRFLCRTWHPDHLPRVADPVQAEAMNAHCAAGFQLILAAKRELLGTF